MRRAFGSVVQRKTKDGKYARGFYVKYRDARTRKIVLRKASDDRMEAEAALALVFNAGRATRDKLPRDMTLWDFASLVYLPLIERRSRPAHLKIRIAEYARAHKALGLRSMRSIRAPEMEDYFAKIEKELSASTLQKHRSALRSLWKCAVSRGVADLDPTATVYLPRITERPVPYLTPADLEALYGSVEPPFRALITFLGETGMREGEAVDLTWGNVRHDLASVAVERSKTGATREVYLTPRAQEVLDGLRRALSIKPQGGDPRLVFPGINRRTLLRRLKHAAERISRPTLRVHDLRHVAATHLVRAGVPPQDVALVLGHSSPHQVVMRYGRHAPENAARRAVQQLAIARHQIGPSVRPPIEI